MFCSKCGNQNGKNLNFCRKCGNELENSLSVSDKQTHLHKKNIQYLAQAQSKDPDELTGNGIGSVIVGDGFFMVAVLLSTIQSPVNSLLWLLLLIPAFFFFGKGFSDVLHAKQIRRRQKELSRAANTVNLPPAHLSIVTAFKNSISGELAALPSVTERTTRNLK